MLRFVALPLIVLFAAPEGSDPERAFQEIVNDVRKQDLVAVWDSLTPGMRVVMGRALRAKMGAKEDADPRELLKAWQAEMAAKPDNPLQALAGLKVKINKVERQGNLAMLTVQTETPGFPRSGVVVLVESGGKWMVKDVKQPGAAEPEARSIKANNLAALVTMRNLVSAQAQFQATGVVDADRDGCGEYGTLAEMGGGVVLRGSGKKLEPPVLSPLFGKGTGGRVTRNGYHFRVYLPGAKGVAVNEKDGPAKIDAKLAEVVWCAYAWPVKAGATGNRAFFVNQMGDVFTTDAGEYSGDKEPSPYAIFPPDKEKKAATSISGDLIPGKKSGDGRIWKIGG